MIERTVKVEDQILGGKVSFQPDADIEGHDEVRLYILEDWLFNDRKYRKGILFSDGFAIVVVNLSNMEILYNSHTENPLIIDALSNATKSCIGKIYLGEYQQNNCVIESY